MQLPEIYKNKIEDEIKNSQAIYYSKDRDENTSLTNLPVDAFIETKHKMFRTTIVGKTNNYLVTNQGDVIELKDCLSIKKI